jgi:feruloyl esterase
MWLVHRILTAVVTAMLTIPAGAAGAHGAGPGPGAIKPVMSCGDVTHVQLAGFTVQSAGVTSAGSSAPYCDVRGVIAPADTVVMRLPVRGWTQRYVQTGCGGLCGMANISYPMASSCAIVADGTVASATTDMGHQGLDDGSWAAGNPQAQIDFSYRSVHETAVVAKAMLARFYGRAPARSYFDGCSDGGREALMEAQRYPHDFDGIAAGAPANNVAVQNTFHHAWNVLTNLDANGKYILLADRLPVIHTAVLAACDLIDGRADGVIGDPRLCHFDPATLICRAGQVPAACLSKAEAGVVERLHDGATDAHGDHLEVPISHEWGSELEWTLFVPAAQGQVVGSEMFALSYLRYLAEPNNPRPDLQLTDLKMTVSSFWQTVLPSSTYMAAMDPDLRAFAAAGGKLLLWHGWNDQHISPQSTLAYWDAMRSTMGGGTVARFARLFLFPGVAHCGGGEGPSDFDVLTPLMGWVENGRAPSRVIASGADETRPAFSYPTEAWWNGTAFVPETAARPVRNDDHWVGEKLYSHGYQTWPRAVGDRLVIFPRPR